MDRSIAFWIFAALFLGLLYWLFIAKPTPLRYRRLDPEMLKKMLEALYHRGFDGGRLILERRREERARVVKRIAAVGDVRLRLIAAEQSVPSAVGSDGVEYADFESAYQQLLAAVGDELPSLTGYFQDVSARDERIGWQS